MDSNHSFRNLDESQADSPVTTGDKWPAFWVAVVAIFPDICPEYAREKAAEYNWGADAFISRLLDNQEAGDAYPTRAPAPKRKRDDDGEAEAEAAEATVREDTVKFLQKKEERARKSFDYLTTYTKAASFLLQGAFPRVYATDIATVFRESQNGLYRSYLALRDEFAKPEGQTRFALKKAQRPAFPWDRYKVHDRSGGKIDPATKREAELEALAEFNAIHDLLVRVEQRKATKEDAATKEEQANRNKAEAEGTLAECSCCYSDVPFNRMVHCDGNTAHYFCYTCARSLAETQIGLSRHELNCMSPDHPDCTGVFSQSQKNLFLDKNLTTALDRIEGSAVLRMAGIENLETCPFCPYAAEYPPKEENSQFMCENPQCRVMSCRLCRGKSHIPKSCDEVKAETAAQSKRHDIEEAMTQALIRKCNKCGTPFIKMSGCNKMQCTNCKSKQCYICSKTITDYTHFNTIGGCPLNDTNLEAQHAQRVNEAEIAAREKLLQENPEFRPDHLQFKFSKTVQDEEAKKRQAGGRLPPGHAHPPPYAAPYDPFLPVFPPADPVEPLNDRERVRLRAALAANRAVQDARQRQHTREMRRTAMNLQLERLQVLKAREADGGRGWLLDGGDPQVQIDRNLRELELVAPEIDRGNMEIEELVRLRTDRIREAATIGDRYDDARHAELTELIRGRDEAERLRANRARDQLLGPNPPLPQQVLAPADAPVVDLPPTPVRVRGWATPPVNTGPTDIPVPIHQRYNPLTPLPTRPAGGEGLPQAPWRNNEAPERPRPRLPRPEIIPIVRIRPPRPQYLDPYTAAPIPNPLNPPVPHYPLANNRPMVNPLYDPVLAAARAHNAAASANNTATHINNAAARANNAAPDRTRPWYAGQRTPTRTEAAQPQAASPARPVVVIDLTGEGDGYHPNTNRPNQVTVGGNRRA